MLMINTARNRAVVAHIVDPVAKTFLALRATPSGVSLVGALGAAFAALITFPFQDWRSGTIAVAVFACSDLLDGTMARLSGKDSTWGAFLDSTLDRVTDGAISLAILLGVASWGEPLAVLFAGISMVAGQVIPYAKARAEGLGLECNVGIAERPERTVLMLLFTLLAALDQASYGVLVLGLLAVLSFVTVMQRMLHVRRLLNG